MIDDNDIHRLDEIYVRKDDCQNIQSEIEKKLSNDSTRFAVLLQWLFRSFQIGFHSKSMPRLTQQAK